MLTHQDQAWQAMQRGYTPPEPPATLPRTHVMTCGYCDTPLRTASAFADHLCDGMRKAAQRL